VEAKLCFCEGGALAASDTRSLLGLLQSFTAEAHVLINRLGGPDDKDDRQVIIQAGLKLKPPFAGLTALYARSSYWVTATLCRMWVSVAVPAASTWCTSLTITSRSII
jgi:hypothetical protein